jgi:hypothetical protein
VKALHARVKKIREFFVRALGHEFFMRKFHHSISGLGIPPLAPKLSCPNGCMLFSREIRLRCALSRAESIHDRLG